MTGGRSWLPLGFEFLSIVPESERRRTVLVTIQAYVEDTGLDGRAQWFVFLALLGTAEDWAAVSDAWRDVLDESPKIRDFKMDEATDLDGQFYGMPVANRDYKLTRWRERYRVNLRSWSRRSQPTSNGFAGNQGRERASQRTIRTSGHFITCSMRLAHHCLSLLITMSRLRPYSITRTFLDRVRKHGGRSFVRWPRRDSKQSCQAILFLETTSRRCHYRLPT